LKEVLPRKHPAWLTAAVRVNDELAAELAEDEAGLADRVE